MAKPVHQFDRLPGSTQGGKPSAGNVAEMISGSAERPAGEPLVGVLYNSHSHRNRGQDLAGAERPGVLVARPASRDDTPAVMEYFAKVGIDFLVLNGGDGTIRDALTAALPFFGEKFPLLAVLPKGKTNALNVDLGAPKDWTLDGAIKALNCGKRIKRRPFAFTDLLAGDTVEQHALLGFIIGGGAIATGVEVGQQAHKLGAFNSFAVGMTGFWGVIQAMFGTDENIWRRGSEVSFRLGHEGLPVPHSGYGHPARRGLLLATTLDKLPMGIKPFGKASGAMRIAIMDRLRRRLTALFPAIIAGYAPEWLGKAGYHQLATDRMDMEIGDSFILDGEAFPPGSYRIELGPELTFVVP